MTDDATRGARQALSTAWKGLHDLEIATCAWVSWFNERRLHEALGDLTPTEYETAHYRALPQATAA